jgi:hypothetical protein
MPAILALRRDRSAISASILRGKPKSVGDDALVEIHPIFDQHGTESPVTSPKIGMRQVHGMY